LLKTNLQIFRTYEAEAICLGTKNRTLFYVHEGVYVLHVCIVVVGKSNKKDSRRIMKVT